MGHVTWHFAGPDEFSLAVWLHLITLSVIKLAKCYQTYDYFRFQEQFYSQFIKLIIQMLKIDRTVHAHINIYTQFRFTHTIQRLHKLYVCGLWEK